MARGDLSESSRSQNGTHLPTETDAKARRQQLNRRGDNLFKKACELNILCSVDIYVLIHDNGRFKSFNSSDEKQWLLSQERLARIYPVPVVKTPADYKREALSIATRKRLGLIGEGIQRPSPKERERIKEIKEEDE